MIRFWLDARVRAVAFQVVVVLLVALAAWYLISNTVENLRRQNIATGFDFLGKPASFEIGESLIPYSSSDTYAKALIVGALNTLKVSLIGIVITVIVGTFIGIARLSSNWLVSRLAAAYIEAMQDIPVLLHLFFWYALFYETFPGPRQALSLFDCVYICNRGVFFPRIIYNPAYKWIALSFVAASLISFLLKKWSDRRQARTGKTFPVFRVSLAIIVSLPILSWFAAGKPLDFEIPRVRGFNFVGGLSFSPEFMALLLGLVLYTAAFVAEIVRAGIQSVSKGQWEAALSLGLTHSQVLRLVVLPQALRVIVPPLTSQMLNLTKNSSLAVAIGYPDFVSVANTTINQTGQAVEGVALIMLVYLFFSLSTSAFMNWYNRKVKLVER
ncbi:amino acid ABC transporter permease [Thermodesulforhabdus norvegica]|uniref:General L-amino acid transport system permease protein n=1 Tax=Thermodesulforhabdus norvegica TaxID=39841 RepID=A0A1I4UI98_9BACT|nr:amino acid ABC transporter permease [Thermodesulforhabdus norvegica]SFM88635.1 general L-amino acid transport system permease protein [Thermodesulforhabdus norvegica]